MNNNQENISLKNKRTSKNAPTDDSIFYRALYDLYVFIVLAKEINDIKNNRTIILKELKKMEQISESTCRRFS